ncbi:hypothetical protein TA3x_003791 [Tundrisphaera sp. TA3]|uniref:hypothetical protein n=1 Tax=Tundrisphaera sp. TA3 TaxID=3435775 RepID=UPI003EB92A7D
MGGFFRIFCCPTLPILAILALRIWRPVPPDVPARSVSDRIAWTVFALGIGLMLNMVLYSILLESEGNYRSWETIRLHGRVFLAIALIPVAGPLIVFVRQNSRRDRRLKISSRESATDEA